MPVLLCLPKGYIGADNRCRSREKNKNRMLQALIKKGIVVGEEIPAPVVSKGSVLIKVVNSCISAGTEMSGVKSSKKLIIKKALEQPEKVKKVLNMIRDAGIAKAYQTVTGKLEAGVPTGYSISGIVIGIGDDVDQFEIGNHVAAAGAGIANHAEYVDVPVNLVVKIPKDMSFKDASTVTLGAIALQGVRRADLRVGEFCVVFGSGILGLIAVQLLKLSGVRVMAVDLDKERLKIAQEYGAEFTVNPTSENPVQEVLNYTGGYGADVVLFTAATSKSDPLSQSFQMCRKKGKVVLVGVAGMQIKREDMYLKELDFLISTSYGPGRYDSKYEEKGLEYPYAYVRWTENRNMSEYLRLVYKNEINLEKLINAQYPIERVTDAFESLKGEDKPILVCLDYGETPPDLIDKLLYHDRKIIIESRPVNKKVVNVALVGAGGFAALTHLPNMQKLSDKYQLHGVVDINGYKAKSIARQYGAGYSTTKYNDVLNDNDIDLVMVCTRHDSHADLVLKALEANKNVFVEKPLAVNEKELEKIKLFFETHRNKPPVLMVGFNRRFSKYAIEIKKHTDNRINPLFMRYRMNAGYIPRDHWVHENRGRIVGEACHIVDLMTYLTGCEIISVNYESLSPVNDYFSPSDNKSIILKYKDGSIGSIDYFGLGSREYPKEHMEVHFDEKTIILDDYKNLRGFNIKIDEISSSESQKGLYEELLMLHDVLIGKKKNWLIEPWDMFQTTAVTLMISQ
jgi:predicted dehydrogenase/threonine dehydrogenase-like Zn-dependent dehydrogenase